MSETLFTKLLITAIARNRLRVYMRNLINMFTNLKLYAFYAPTTLPKVQHSSSIMSKRELTEDWKFCGQYALKYLKKLNWEVFTIKIFKVAIYVNRLQNLTIVHFLAFSRPFWWDFSHFWQVYCDSRVPWLNRKWNCLNRKWNYSDLSGRLPLSNRWF